MFCANLGAVLTVIGSEDYWHVALSASQTASDIYVDPASGNILTNARISNNYVVYTPAGAISSQFGASTALGMGRYAQAISAVGPVLGAYDTANNLTVVAHSTWAGANVWKRRISGSAIAGPVGLALDSANNIYVGAMNDATSATNIMKLDSAGAILWQKSVTPPIPHIIYNTVGQIFAVDNSNNLIMARAGTGGSPASYLTKFDSAGTVLWQRTFRDLTNNYLPLFVRTVTLSNGDIVCVGYYVDATTSYGLIVKYSAAGALVFQRRVSPGANNIIQFLGVTVDALDNVYVSGSYENAAGTDSASILMAFTSAGALIWQNRWSRTAFVGGETSAALAIKGSTLYATAIGGAGLFQSLLAVPADGTKTGTYGIYTYAATSFTASAISVFTSATTTATTATTTTTATAFTSTIAATSYTRTLTDIP